MTVRANHYETCGICHGTGHTYRDCPKQAAAEVSSNAPATTEGAPKRVDFEDGEGDRVFLRVVYTEESGSGYRDATDDDLLHAGFVRPPATHYVSNGEAGDGQHVCSLCGGDADEPHANAVCYSAGESNGALAENHRLTEALAKAVGVEYVAQSFDELASALTTNLAAAEAGLEATKRDALALATGAVVFNTHEALAAFERVTGRAAQRLFGQRQPVASGTKEPDWATEEVTSGEPGSFGCDPRDSAALLRLREAVDLAGLWPSDKAREDGEYEAAVAHMAKLAGHAIQPHNEWVAQEPQAKAVNDLAHGWGADDIQAGGRGLSLDEALRAYPEASTKAMRRMREAAASYLAEMAALIEDNDYSEILHQAGHVEFEMTSLRRLTLALGRIARGEPATAATQDPPPSLGAPDAPSDSAGESHREAEGVIPVAPDRPGDGEEHPAASVEVEPPACPTQGCYGYVGHNGPCFPRVAGEPLSPAITQASSALPPWERRGVTFGELVAVLSEVRAGFGGPTGFFASELAMHLEHAAKGAAAKSTDTPRGES